MIIQIDYDQALRDMKYHQDQKFVTFGPYSPTYVFAQSEDPAQDIKSYMYNEQSKKYCKKVLTMASSGDQALCCKMYGSKDIDITIFDWTYTAKIMTDIKTFAIKILNFDEYMQLLKDLYHNPSITSVPNFDRILPQLDSTEQEYIHVMNGRFALFDFGPTPTDERLAKVYWPKLIHQALHSIDLQPFTFIWSDIAHLDAMLDDNKYDFIHLSNIFDFVSDDVKISVLNQLTKRLNKSGRILMCTMHDHDYELEDICKNIKTKDLKYIHYPHKMLLLKCR